MLGIALCAASLTSTASQERPRRGAEVDLALVLAVDASGSVDRGELAVQRDGYVAALRHPDFARAVRTGRRGRIAVAYFEWSGRPIAGAAVPWMLIDGPDDAAALAAEIADLPQHGGYGTSISRAIDLAVALIEAAQVSAARLVIDVSGDGPNNMGPPLAEAHTRALARDVTINGLPLVLRPVRGAVEDIVRYYEDCVIGGDGAFLV